MVQNAAIGLGGERRATLARSTNPNPLNARLGPGTRSASQSLDRGDAVIDMRVAQLLCSRLCHDLVGPAGAVHNGVELMGEIGGDDPAALSLVAASSMHLNNRLAFYRVAFGLGGGTNRMMSVDEAKDLARGVVESTRVTLDWQTGTVDENGSAGSHPVDGVRVVLGLILIAIDALPRGGTVSVRCTRSRAGLEATVTARGANAGVAEDLLAAMDPDAPAESLTARTVHGYFVATLARRFDTALEIDDAKPDEITLTASLPRPWPTDTVLSSIHRLPV